MLPKLSYTLRIFHVGHVIKEGFHHSGVCYYPLCKHNEIEDTYENGAGKKQDAVVKTLVPDQWD